MRLSEEMQAFVDSPDTFEFVTRATDSFLNYVQTHPGVVLTQSISGRYVLGYIDRSNYEELVNTLGTSFIGCTSCVLGLLSRPALESAGILQVQNQPYLDLTGRGVLIGFVDTGIDYTQEVFRFEDGSSKIRAIYDQTAEYGDPPEGFFFGREYTNEDIERALQADDPFSVVPQRDTVGHGTFLASLAAGRRTETYIGAAPEAEIIAVKLRQAKPFYLERYFIPDDVPAYSSSSVIVGIDYILKKAEEANRPVVICLGLGTNFGSHDGFSILEQYLSEISARKGVCVCIAAGNESQQRHHTTGQIQQTGGTANLEMEVVSERENVFLSIWNLVSDRFSVAVRSPSGELVSRVPARPGSSTTVNLIFERAEVTIEYYFPVEGSGSQLTVVRIQNATPGIWTVTLYGDIILDGTYHAWLPLTGFVAPDTEFLTASPYYTVTVPSTAVGIISCGAYDNNNLSLYLNSSWGPTRLGSIRPDFVAPGVGVGGYFPYGFGTLSGTSVAAAITAGACAQLLQWGIVEGNEPTMSTYQIRAYLIRGCTRTTALTYPNEQWGYGTLNLLRTFDEMREQ